MDSSEVHALAARFYAAPPRVMVAIVPVAERAGVAMKKTMKADASGHRHLPGLAAHVNYSIDAGPMQVAVAVGFTKSGQGNLANIAAFGTVRNGPVMDITRGLRDEVPKFTKWVAKAGAEVL